MKLPKHHTDRNLESFIKELSLVFLSLDWKEEDLIDVNRATVEERVRAEFEKQKLFILNLQENAALGLQLRSFMLQQIDMNWMSHLDNMTRIKEGIGLSGYGQQDPYQLFEKEAFAEFNQLMNEIESGISIHFMEHVREELKDKKEIEQ